MTKFKKGDKVEIHPKRWSWPTMFRRGTVIKVYEDEPFYVHVAWEKSSLNNARSWMCRANELTLVTPKEEDPAYKELFV